MIEVPSTLPITEDDAFLAAAFEEASIPTLLLSMVHVTGDPIWIRGPVRPKVPIAGEMQGYLSDEDKALVRAQALGVFKAFRDGGGRLPEPPSRELVREMMSFLVGEEVPAEYVPMMLEELALRGDTRSVDWSRVPAPAKQKMRVLVIGAGMSGLLMAIRLEEAGIPYLLVEKNAGVGGTWFENSYPGCRVDVQNHFYSYSFEPNHGWSEFFSRRDELKDYFERCAAKFGVLPKIRFETEVVSLRFDEARADWQVVLRSFSGDEALRFAAVVSAVGQLNRPKIPDFPGLADFRGAAFHSAQWQHEHDLSGQRVGVVGTGASAFQIVPTIADQVEQLVVFQRSPAWPGPNPNYHARVPAAKKWLLEHIPYYARWYRFLIFWPGSDQMLRNMVVDPSWPHPERSVSAANDLLRESLTANIVAQVGDRPELLAKVLPSYPPMIKRYLQDNGSWFAALKRDNVELETSGIARFTPTGIRTQSGVEHSLDIVVFATGFHASRFLWPMQVLGKGGASLEEEWGEDPRAYLGITVPRFPNLFILYGPNTNLSHAGSIIFHSECQVRYVLGCLEALLEHGKPAMECREDVNADFNERLDRALEKLVLTHPGETSWYKNSKGRVTATSPWRLVDYWAWTRKPELEDYEWVEAQGASTADGKEAHP